MAGARKNAPKESWLHVIETMRVHQRQLEDDLISGRDARNRWKEAASSGGGTTDGTAMPRPLDRKLCDRSNQ